MKQTKHFLTTIAALLCCVVTNAEIRDSGTCGDNLNWFLTTDGELVIQGAGRMADYNWQETPWIEYEYDIEKVSIREGVTYIGKCAFADFYGPTLMNIPNSVTEIGEGAFAGCNSSGGGELILDCNMALPEGVFVGCGFSKVSIGDGVTSIGDYAFAECSNLTSITISESVTSIGNEAFSGCRRLTSITIPGSVASIGCGAFMNCSRLTSITILEGVTLIDQQAFRGCNNLTFITFPKSVTEAFVPFEGCCTDSIVVYGYIPRGAFMEGDFAKVIIDNSVTSIGEAAFHYCSSLTSITIPESVTSIGDYAFTNCSSLTSIVIPENSQLTSIGYDAFYGCSSLTSITIPESVTSIGSNAFKYCSSLTSITIPESVTSIGDYAFAECSSLTSIVIPESVTSIGDDAFTNCSSLISIAISENSQLTSIGSWAFDGCSSLTAITIPESVTSIGSYAFQSCSSLTSITIPENVTYIGHNTFYDCRSLTSITVDEENPLYDSREGCNAIIETSRNKLIVGCSATVIPESVTSIGEYAFCGCSSLTAITLPESVTSIGGWAFEDCSSLTAITIPESVTSIEWRAFSNCRSLTSITVDEENPLYDSREGCNAIIKTSSNTLIVGCSATVIPESVTSIVSYAFYGCSSLTAITIPSSVTSIGDETFYDCSSLTDVYCYAEEVPTTNSNAFTHSNIGNATLHVPASALEAYKITAPWSRFGEFEILTPTSVTITINQYGSGTYSSEYALDFSEVEGLKAYAAAGYNKKTGVVTLLRVNTTQPGAGIFLKGEPGKKYEVSIIEESDDNVMNMLVGTLTETSVNGTSTDGLYANYKYTIKEGDAEPKFYQFADGSTLGAGKAYLQIPTAWLPAANEARSIGLRFDEGEGTTDMEELTNDNSQLTIIYDLTGRRVAQPVKGSLYIVNGKKVIK